MSDNLVPIMEGTIHLIDAGRAGHRLAEMLFTRIAVQICALPPRCNGMDRFLYASACIVRRKRLFDHCRDKTMRKKRRMARAHAHRAKSNEVFSARIYIHTYILARGNAYGNNTRCLAADVFWRIVLRNRVKAAASVAKIMRDTKRRDSKPIVTRAHAKVNIGILRVAPVEAVLFAPVHRKNVEETMRINFLISLILTLSTDYRIIFCKINFLKSNENDLGFIYDYFFTVNFHENKS